MRLIDADALKVDWYDDYETEDGDEYSYTYVSKYQIDNAPTIDAVPVVRCKDCAGFKRDEGEGIEGWCIAMGTGAVKDGYCSLGERKAEP